MQNLKIFVCGHDNTLNLINKKPFLELVNLNNLQIGKFQTNQFSESRIFFSDLLKTPVEYIGFASASWNSKWSKILPLNCLDQLELSPNVLWCPSLEDFGPNVTWITNCNHWWPELIPYILEMSQVSGFSLNAVRAPICNSFICHWDIWQFFIQEWFKLFDWLYKTHPIERVLKELKLVYADYSRLYGYILERMSMLILSNLPFIFKDFKIKTIPLKERKLPLKLILP